MNNIKSLPDISVLESLFSYDHKTGLVTAKVSKGTRKKGSIVGTKDSHGYFVVKLNQKVYKLHRVIWCLYHHHDPGDLFIDHINGDPGDNKIDNLRLATNQQNQQNQHNAKGYYFNKKNKKFLSKIIHDGNHVHLGMFDFEDDARDAYLKAKQKLHSF